MNADAVILARGHLVVSTDKEEVGSLGRKRGPVKLRQSRTHFTPWQHLRWQKISDVLDHSEVAEGERKRVWRRGVGVFDEESLCGRKSHGRRI